MTRYDNKTNTNTTYKKFSFLGHNRILKICTKTITWWTQIFVFTTSLSWTIKISRLRMSIQSFLFEKTLKTTSSNLPKTSVTWLSNKTYAHVLVEKIQCCSSSRTKQKIQSNSLKNLSHTCINWEILFSVRDIRIIKSWSQPWRKKQKVRFNCVDTKSVWKIANLFEFWFVKLFLQIHHGGQWTLCYEWSSNFFEQRE